MGFRRSALEDLAALRARGQRPEFGLVIVGESDGAAWASRNRFFFVGIRDLGEDLIAFTGLHVIVRAADPSRYSEAIQRLTLVAAMVSMFDTRNMQAEFLVA